MQNPDVWTNVCLFYLTPQSLGLVESTSKTLLRVVKADPRVWQRQAVLAWNGFYLELYLSRGCFRAVSEKFLSERKSDREYPWNSLDSPCSRMPWCNWHEILCSMEVLGDGYKTIGYATECPKEVTMHEVDVDWDLYDDKREWVEEMKENVFEEDCYTNSSSFEDESDDSSSYSSSS
jgi:hypothetical protein